MAIRVLVRSARNCKKNVIVVIHDVKGCLSRILCVAFRLIIRYVVLMLLVAQSDTTRSTKICDMRQMGQQTSESLGPYCMFEVGL